MTLVDAAPDFRVSRRIYRDAAIHEEELERIFRRSWLFVAHESEVPEPGDYVTRPLGLDPVIVTRADDGQVHVLLNSCRHRGVPLCRSDVGNSSHFRCSYHGWTYAGTGALRGVTYQREVYGPDFDKADFGLHRARVATRHGLVFATWDPDVEDLDVHLGPLDFYLEAIFGKFAGGLEVVGPPVRTRMPVNWKAESENLSGDGYHTLITHGTAVTLGLFPTAEAVAHLGRPVGPKFPGRTVDCGNGHTTRVQNLPVEPERPSFYGYPEELWPEIEARLDPRQVDIQSRLSVTHGNVFPNLSFLENFKTGAMGPGSMCRYIRLTLKVPLAADRTEVWWWHLVPADAPAEWKVHSQKAYNATNGPAGMFEIDDGENFVGMTEANRGSFARSSEYRLIAGAHHPRATDLGWPGDVQDADRSEHTIRAFLRRHQELLAEAPGTPVAVEPGSGS